MDISIFKPLLKQFIKFYYEDLENGAGGNLHIALDDGNLHDDDIYFCQEEAMKNGDSFGYFLATLMRSFKEEELEKMYFDNHWGIEEKISENSTNMLMDYNAKDFEATQTIKELKSKYDEIFLLALSKKGYVFKHYSESYAFITTHCRAEDNVKLKQKIYFVKEEPFLLWNYEIQIEHPFIKNDRETIISASSGSFKFL